ncbi:hypothetical protein ACOMHN_040890 [Nucella lapillus]
MSRFVPGAIFIVIDRDAKLFAWMTSLRWTFCTPKYKVYDNNDHCVFTIIGDCCHCKCCVDIVFRVCEGDGEGEEVGQVRKHFGGAREICGGAIDFSLFMPANMDVMNKGLLLGTTFLIDFNYFEAQ